MKYLLILIMVPFCFSSEKCSEYVTNNQFKIIKKYIHLKTKGSKSRHLKINEINYNIFGENNEETIILIHGLDSAGATFFNITEDLAKEYKVITYDQRGHGQTKDLGFNFNSHLLANDLKVLLDHLEINNPHILGHSMGARTAIRFANLFPNKIKSLIIEDMELFSRVQNKHLNKNTIDKTIELYKSLKKSFKGENFKNREELKNALEPYFGEESLSLTYRRAIEKKDGSFELLFRPWVSVQYSYQGNIEDFTKELKELKVPTLIMQADPKKSRTISDKGLVHLKNNLKNHHHVLFEEAGHTIHRANKEKFLNELTLFIKKISFTKKI